MWSEVLKRRFRKGAQVEAETLLRPCGRPDRTIQAGGAPPDDHATEGSVEDHGRKSAPPRAADPAIPALSAEERLRVVPEGHTILGLDQSWVDGGAILERPCHFFSGFGAAPELRAGAFTYSWSHIPPSVASIGRYCSIADRVQFGHAEHPTAWLSTSSFTYDHGFMGRPGGYPIPGSRFRPVALPDEKKREPIRIGNDVWVGHGAYIRNGVSLGDGCIVGAHAVVTRDVPPYAIVVGNQARIARYRFDERTIQRLLDLRWWRYAFTEFEDVDVSRVADAIDRLADLIANGMTPYDLPPVVVVGNGSRKDLVLEDGTLISL